MADSSIMSRVPLRRGSTRTSRRSKLDTDSTDHDVFLDYLVNRLSVALEPHIFAGPEYFSSSFPFDDSRSLDEASGGVHVSGQTPKKADPWEGPEDPENPKNWPAWRRYLVVALISTMNFTTPMSSSICAPAIPQITASFRFNGTVLSSFVVSIYVLGFAVGPLFIAPASEIWGRSVIYHITNVCTVGLTIGCALSNNIGTLLAFRFLAGCIGATPIAVGGGTIADVSPPAQRGMFMALFAIGGLLGLIVGPITGGFLAAGPGWRWCFWFMTILSGVVTVGCFILLKETHPPTILKRRANRYASNNGAAETGRVRKPATTATAKAQVFRMAFSRPLRLLLFCPPATAMSSYLALLYGYLYLMLTTFNFVFMDRYHWSNTISGLAYIGLGLGTFLGVWLNLALSDKLTASKKRNSSEPYPEGRLLLMAYTAPLVPAGLLWYGWSAQAHAHWIVPTLGTVVLGSGIISASIVAQTYLVDVYTEYAASAMACSTFLRSIAGAFLPLAGNPLYSKLGLGWGTSLLALISVFGCIAPFLLMRYGPQLRSKRPLEM